jgi:hypothetical protein
MMENELNLENPQDWGCKVESFTVLHNIMWIRLRNRSSSQADFHLLFRHVAYFSGWQAWPGANLKIATQDEMLNYIVSADYGRTN